MYQNDEDIPSEEEEEFEETATRFQDKFRKLSGKFQQILLQESMVRRVIDNTFFFKILNIKLIINKNHLIIAVTTSNIRNLPNGKTYD